MLQPVRKQNIKPILAHAKLALAMTVHFKDGCHIFMSRKYKFHNSDGMYFISFATLNWMDVFVREKCYATASKHGGLGKILEIDFC